jgi:hypothetical protein
MRHQLTESDGAWVIPDGTFLRLGENDTLPTAAATNTNHLAAKDGVIYQSTGSAWVGIATLAGGTLTGNLEIEKSAPQITLDATGANKQGQINFQNAGVAKWAIYKPTDDSLRIFDEAAGADTLFLVTGGGFAIRDGITAPTAASGRAYLYVDTADGDLKVRFGDGTTKTLATDT